MVKVNYLAGDSREQELVLSKDLLIVRLKEYLHFEVLRMSLSPFAIVELVDYYPEVKVYVLKVLGLEPDTIRAELLIKIRKQAPNWLVYIGKVFRYKNLGGYQIYTGNLFIHFQEDVTFSRIQSLVDSYGFVIKSTLGFASKTYFLRPKKPLHKDIFYIDKELLALSEVKYCHPELVTKRKTIFGNLKTAELVNTGIRESWWREMIELDEALLISKGKGIKIAIIDNGLDFSHPAFPTTKIAAYRDMNFDDISKRPDHRFLERHGTACAGIAASNYSPALGVAPEAQLIPIRNGGLGSILESEAFFWAAQQGADIISCSWGPPDADFTNPNARTQYYPIPDHTHMALNYVAREGRAGKGSLVFFAGGNGNEKLSSDQYASHPKVMAIGSCNRHKKKSVFSDYGKPLFGVFPAGDYKFLEGEYRLDHGIKVTDRLRGGYVPGPVYDSFTGTSASCPGFAGVAALALAANPELDREALQTLLKESCQLPNSPANYTSELGYGIINAKKAVHLVLNQINLKPQIMSHQTASSLHIGVNFVKPEYHTYISPLKGCVNDMLAMQTFAKNLGYQTKCLKNEEATAQAIVSNILDLGNSLSDGGILMISFAGHGAPVKDRLRKDEKDGFDESWVCYDRFLLDDEINNALAQISSKIRVVVISDSCHSATTTRGISNDLFRVRKIDPDQVQSVFNLMGTNEDDYFDRYRKASRGPGNVFVKNLAACKEKELAGESAAGGNFTVAFLNQYKEGMSYEELMELISEKLSGQNPDLSNSHLRSIEFDREPAFDTNPKLLTAEENSVDEVLSIKNPNAELPTFLGNGKLVVFDGDNSEELGERSFELNCRKTENEGIWDNAYDYFFQNERKDYVEPIISASIYRSNEPKEGKRGSKSKSNDYLFTYPNAAHPNYQSKNPVPFIWHLGDNYSQLRSAAEEVFPKMKTSKEVPKSKNVVRIAHIDTGLIEDHPMNPQNPLKKGSYDVDSGKIEYDTNDLLMLNAIEQEGHGTATAALLAGPWIETEVPSSGNSKEPAYKGFFGAIPFAQVLSIKTSETVAILNPADTVKAFKMAFEHKVDVITMSMAGVHCKRLAKVVNEAYERGIVVVTAGGNSWSSGFKRRLPDSVMYPSRYQRVITATGASVNDKPYLVKEQRGWEDESSRAAGGTYMQTCWGPPRVMKTAIAGYTPNVMWFSNKNKEETGYLFTKSGGGTSSATPQIAAAAALYIEKYREELSDCVGDKAWEKAEIVRQALFLSAHKDSDYAYVYGNGKLKAKRAISAEFSPAKIRKKVKLQKADPAPVRIKLLGGLFGLYWSRSVGHIGFNQEPKQEAVLREMLATELSQLVYLDETLVHFAGKLNLENYDPSSAANHIEINDPELWQAILNSKKASQTLKQVAMGRLNEMGAILSQNSRSLNSGSVDFVENAIGKFRIAGQFVDVKAKPRPKVGYTSTDQGMFEEIELDIQGSRGVGQDLKRTIIIEPEATDDCLLYFIEKSYADGNVIQLEPLNVEDSTNQLVIDLEDDFSSANRGGFLKKIGIKVFKWVKKKVLNEWLTKATNHPKVNDFLAEKVGEKQYEWLVFDLSAKTKGSTGDWFPLEGEHKKDVLKELSKAKKEKVLLLMHGLWSSCENSFQEFLSDPHVRKSLLASGHCKYALGFNMPTTFHGIKENAERLQNDLKIYLPEEGKVLNVLAHSRGGLVARYLLEALPADKSNVWKVNRLIMAGTPNEGTNIALNQKWDSLFGILGTVTNLISPMVAKVFSVIKWGANFTIDFPGIDDQETNSNLIQNLNKLDFNRSNYFVLTSNYEPSNRLVRLLDQVVDKGLHEGDNDLITPVNGAVFKGAYAYKSKLDENQYYVFGVLDHVSHFQYTNPVKAPKAVELILKQLH